MATTSPDLLDPNTPKKKPTAPATGVPAAAGTPTPSALDTGIPPPAAPPAPQAAPVANVPAMDAAPAPAPTGITVEQGGQQLQQQAIARGGRTLNPAEIQELARQVGPPQGPGGTYTPQQLQMAEGLVGRYSFNPADPFGALAESAPGSATSLANQRISELLQTDLNEVDPNSQAIQQPMAAFRSAQSRATDRAKISNALRAQREGTSGGGEEAGLMGLLEEQGQNEASFEANLYAQELAGQRSRLTEAIQLATQAGLQNKARELQAELGKLDIDLRRLLGQGQLALGARSLDQNDRQFLDQMGLNWAQLQAQQNNAAIEQLLG